MLSNREFAAVTHTDISLSPDMAEMAMFTIDMGDAMENGSPMFPHLVGKGVNLWDITPRRDGMTLAEFAKVEAKEKELDRLARLAQYIQQGYAEDERALTDPNGGEDEGDDEAPEVVDEWERFFAEDMPRNGRKSHRRGGVRNTGDFEKFVDSAQ